MRLALVRRVVREAALVAFVGIALSLPATAAHAHAGLKASTPADGAVLDRAPATISLTFTEPPDPDLAAVDVLDSNGSSVVAGQVEPDGRFGLLVPVDELADGPYTVTWLTTSQADSHTVSGAFTFGVGVQPGPVDPSVERSVTPRPSPLAVVGRWLLYAGLAVFVATASTQALVVRDTLPKIRVILPLAWGAAAAGLACIALAQAGVAEVPVGTLLDSATGGPLLRQGLAVLLAGAAVVGAVRRPSRTGALVVGGTAAVALLFHTLAGHANAQGTWRWFDIAVQWAHVCAVGVWIGGLIWLLVDVRAGVRGREADVRRYSSVAGVSIAVVLVTGVLRSVDLLGGWSRVGRLLSTDWGTALLVKLGLFAALAALGAWNRYVNVRRIERRGGPALRRFLIGEIVLAAGVFGVTGVLAGLPPPATDLLGRPAPPASVVVRGADFATTTRATLTVAPGTPGPNRFDVRVVDFDSGKSVQATGVALRIEPESLTDVGPTTVELRRSGEAWTARSGTISIEGPWSVVVVVERSDGGVEIPLELRTRAPPEQTAPRPTQSVSVIPGTGGLPDIVTVALPGGSSVQAYVDPARPGGAELHFTAFDPQGGELALSSARSSATSPEGDTRPVRLDRLSPGHFVGSVELTAGTWTFSLDSRSEAGAPVRVSFEQEVG